MTMMDGEEPIRLLIVSVGSLVGQNILDSLDFPEFKRRHLVHVIGTNSIADSANNFRCDQSHLLPPTLSPDFPEKLRSLLKEERPDVILCARDADTSVLCRLFEADNELPGKVPFGNLKTVEYALNKWQSFLFCQAHSLPFAETFESGTTVDEQSLRLFTERVGYPMIAKPVEGFASKGVFFVRSWGEVMKLVGKQDYIFQEYLGNPEDMEEYFNLLDGPKPLFAEAPGVKHHTCHVPISPKGKIGEICIVRNHHNFGAVTRLQRISHPELEALTLQFAEAFIEEGGAGPLSVQFRIDRAGRFKAQEMNLRTTGSTFARLMMGQDELGYIIRDLLPESEFPLYKVDNKAFDKVVTKSLYSYSLCLPDIEALKTQGKWSSTK